MLKGASGKLISDVFEIKKDFTDNFTANVTISLPFDPAKIDLAKSDAAVYWYDETAKKWNALSKPSVDKDQAMVSGIVNHFTKFAVFATDKQPTNPTNTGSTGKGTLSDIAATGRKRIFASSFKLERSRAILTVPSDRIVRLRVRNLHRFSSKHSNFKRRAAKVLLTRTITGLAK